MCQLLKIKFMRTLLLLIISSIAFNLTIVSCNQQSTVQPAETTNTISPDSLISQWNLNWNNHDSVALLSMFTDHSAVILSDKERLKGIDAINTGWLRESLPVLSNLKTTEALISNFADINRRLLISTINLKCRKLN